MHKIIPSDDFSTRSQYTIYYISFVHLLYMARDIQTKYCIHICKPGNTTINYSCVKIYTCTARYDFVSCLHFEYPVIKMHSNWGGGGIYKSKLYSLNRKRCKICRSIAYFLLYLWRQVYSIYVNDKHRQLNCYMTVTFVGACAPHLLSSTFRKALYFLAECCVGSYSCIAHIGV